MRILLLLIYVGGTFSPLLDISERNYFHRWGGGGLHVHPPAYAPVVFISQRV